jgi:acyl-CoA dehydrogenase
VDSPSRVTIARQVLRDYEPSPGLWPTQHLPARREAARKKLAHLLDLEIGNL